jgi:hypothetical protein
MKDAVLLVDNGSGPRAVALADALDAEREERALTASYDWIKRLRHISVDGQPLRTRFTLRGDSLWWFAELYLHKQQTMLMVFRILGALQGLVETNRPLAMGIRSGGRLVRALAPQVAQARGVEWIGPARSGREAMRMARLDFRARTLMLAASASRLRPRAGGTGTPAGPVAAFVHAAFWKHGVQEGSAESYIGPVLDSLESRLPPGSVRYIGLGPSENFAARRWWRALGRSRTEPAVVPIERYAPLAALRDSRTVWRERHAVRRALWNSTELREHAVIDGCDCWPIVREELAGIALLQWPWSARAMDEAGAALDALQPRVALTYAEAGGWGRALMLECRRRGIPSVGLQHGFIYRHWLNYLHEADEMAPAPDGPADAGFPRPTLTLLFDDYARSHLLLRGRFPPESLAVTGSPRLDALVAAAGAVTGAEIATVRQAAGADDSAALVVLVAKYKEVRDVLPPLVQAVAAMPGVQLAIKTHPAETPDAYEAAAAGQRNVRVLPASAPLASLLRACRAVVTMNSTVALDAAVLRIPALVIGLPNNLSPFVDAGIMAGAASPAEIAPALERILYDEGFRRELEGEQSAYVARFGMRSNGRAAAQAAEAVLGCQSPVRPEP